MAPPATSPRGAGIVRSLFADDVRVAEVDPRRVDPSVLLPEEERQVARAVDKRRRQFAAGRLLARRLIAELGGPAELPLLNGEDRAPIWPAGIVGTISHTDRWAAVAAARQGEIRSLGCDLELDGPLEPATWRVVLTPDERADLESLPAADRGLMAKRFFCAKEATYKALYPLTGAVLEFDDLELELDPDGAGFQAVLKRPVALFDEGESLGGGLQTADGLIAAAVTIRSCRAGGRYATDATPDRTAT